MLNLRRVALLASLALLAACARNDLDEPPAPLGDFALGLNIVVADNVQKVPISREASVEEWEAVMKQAVADRFGRYQGSRLYNIGISVDGYALAPPGIPIIVSYNAVKRVEQWLVDHPEWFPTGGGVPVPLAAEGDTATAALPVATPTATGVPAVATTAPPPRKLPPPQPAVPIPGPSLP